MPMLNIAMAGPKVNKPRPALIEFKNLRFYITDQPSEKRMATFVHELQGYGVSDLVRVGGANYCIDQIQDVGINVVDLPYEDGTAPDDKIVNSWFKVLKPHVFEPSGGCVAIHCRAGLGRSPALVAAALIELGMKYEDAVALIRRHQPGAINSKQLDYLSKFHRKSRLSSKKHCLGCFLV